MNAAAILSDYVQEKLTGEPVAKRIELTLALAALEPDVDLQANLFAIARDLQRAERRQRRLKFRGGAK